jgi:hypothetical protein
MGRRFCRQPVQYLTRTPVAPLSYNYLWGDSPLKRAISDHCIRVLRRASLPATVLTVQRLYSMFPAGAAGCGLLLLRLCAAGMLLRNVTRFPTVPPRVWETAVLLVLAGALCLGVVTPLICAASALVQALILLRAGDRDLFQFAFSFCVAIALFLLGPGAFSIDSHLFGRKLIPPPKSS